MKLLEKEEQIMFHTLGYEYKPRWNDDKGGYRNWFGIYSNPSNCDYLVIQSLVERGYMRKDGNTAWNEEVYSVTDKGKDYVVDLWLKKKKESKPSKSKRRHQAYNAWCDWNDGSFKDFLDWLCVTEEMRLHLPEEVEIVEDFKRRWDI